MGREVRKVPADWQHPRDEKGKYIPLHGSAYATAGADWDEEWEQWQKGFRRHYGDDKKWEPKDPDDAHMRYTEYAGSRPSPDDYMPDWPESERTHFMMYEDTSEGTPISPAFKTPEELARWLVDNNASSFGSMGASYEGWLRVAQGGFACSMVLDGGVMRSGVDALTDAAP